MVSDVIGNHNVVETGRNGFVCSIVEEFKAAIKQTSTKRLIEVAFEDIQKEYNTIVMGNKYAKIYQEGV